ncbi:rrna-processing protein fcf2 [Coemansia aciculifera]|uniref:Rrna-processing protein fcf2 n=2 Tax=Coemansia TaxID=4863 RepID=A0A9W8GWQ4_9FUNG|nr:rrna-processing protein fcf2 [Coemansia pectinata]KAJ2863302.1 rrna-processing protein fcf2 [Coemansia aciculifera]KAJ2872998.1 rrna-processing protein fcf2 [Coemansia aciculifera]KAJ2879657.1 rrna-processing protein fcf2 [Coemansia aciculifera]
MTFDIDDSELELLLSQAKESLAQKEAQLEQEKLTRDADSGATKTTKQVSALSVPMRLETGSNHRSSPFIKMNNKSGVAKLDTKSLNKSTPEYKEKEDPTVKRATRSEITKDKEETAGKKWFGMKAPVLTPELKNDLRVLQLRNVLDPKRFYKKDASAKKIPKYFEVGTIIEGPTEFYSSRLTKKERKTTLVDELLADKQARDYFKRKVNEIHAHNISGGKNWYKKTTAAAKGGNSKTAHKAKRQRK